jgi:uncharacterized membrane protein
MVSDDNKAGQAGMDNGADAEAKIFSAVITPYRSLGPTGFLIVMLAIGGVSFVTGMVFVMHGAWPVFGFFGLDVLLLYLAFRANYRSARAYEVVTVTASELTVRQVSHRGAVREFTLNPLWARLEKVAHEEFGIQRLFLVSQGKRVPVAGFLSPHEKASFAAALGNAIGEAKRGPTRTVV